MKRALLGLLLAGAAASVAAEPGADDPPAAVRALLDAQVEAWNRGDLEGFMAGYWRSPELVFCSGATVTKGWDATLERYRQRYQAEGREMGRCSASTRSRCCPSAPTRRPPAVPSGSG